MKPDRFAEVKEGVERLIRNLAIQDSISIERAAFLVRGVASSMSKTPPTPTPTPTGDPEVRRAA